MVNQSIANMPKVANTSGEILLEIQNLEQWRLNRIEWAKRNSKPIETAQMEHTIGMLRGYLMLVEHHEAIIASVKQRGRKSEKEYVDEILQLYGFKTNRVATHTSEG